MKKSKKRLIIILISLIIIICSVGLYFANILWFDNVVSNNEGFHYLYIRKSYTFDDIKVDLEENQILKSVSNFEWVAKRKKYTNKIKPGRYKIKKGMNNVEIVDMLRIGKQEPVKLTFISVRTKENLASKISEQLDIDSIKFLNLLNDKKFLKTKGLTVENSISIFIPNTYKVFWTINEKDLFEKMYKEWEKFWNPERKQKAKDLKLTPFEVSVLASIVEWETAKNDEKPTVAGVYLNRLKKDIRLEADPTLIFAHNDFSIRRVLNKHKEIDSPYNTYKYKGLPPGPICIPTPQSIDAVLNPQEHNYLFFCAKETLDGYHNFATTLKEHLLNAKKYQAALNRMNIKK